MATTFDQHVHAEQDRRRAGLPAWIQAALDKIGHDNLRLGGTNSWKMCCPAHGGDNFKMDIDIGDNGALIFVCHSQKCSWEEIRDALEEQYGIAEVELFDPETRAPKGEVAERDWPAADPDGGDDDSDTTNTKAGPITYEYRDEKGTLLRAKVRNHPGSRSKFGWVNPAGETTTEGIRRTLYGLEVIQGQKTAYIAEGEKDCETLRAHGMLAVCNPDGAGAWRYKGETPGDTYTDQLIAAGVERVVIFADNDEPGKAHAQDIVEDVAERGLSAKVILLPGLPLKGDVSDWMQSHTLLDLQEQVVTADEATRTFGFDTERADRVTQTSVSWLWPGYLPVGKFVINAGEPAEGKTSTASDIAARHTVGGAWPDGAANTTGPGSVIIIGLEDSLGDTAVPRLAAAGADLTRIHFLRGLRRSGAAHLERLFQMTKDIGALRKLVKSLPGPVLVIIDPVAAYHGDNVESYKDPEVRAVLTPLVLALEELAVTCIGIMHVKKGDEQSINYKIGGSVAFAALARFIFMCKRDPNDAATIYFTCPKVSCAAFPATLTFQIVGTTLAPAPPMRPKAVDTSRVTWLGSVPLSAQDVFDLTRKKKKGEGKAGLREEIGAELVRLLVVAGGSMPVGDPDFPQQGTVADWWKGALGGNQACSWRTVRRAAEAEGIEKYQPAEGKLAPGWWWRVTARTAEKQAAGF